MQTIAWNILFLYRVLAFNVLSLKTIFYTSKMPSSMVKNFLIRSVGGKSFQTCHLFLRVDDG